jgi:hypothetical protein
MEAASKSPIPPQVVLDGWETLHARWEWLCERFVQANENNEPVFCVSGREPDSTLHFLVTAVVVATQRIVMSKKEPEVIVRWELYTLRPGGPAQQQPLGAAFSKENLALTYRHLPGNGRLVDALGIPLQSVVAVLQEHLVPEDILTCFFRVKATLNSNCEVLVTGVREWSIAFAHSHSRYMISGRYLEKAKEDDTYFEILSRPVPRDTEWSYLTPEERKVHARAMAAAPIYIMTQVEANIKMFELQHERANEEIVARLEILTEEQFIDDDDTSMLLDAFDEDDDGDAGGSAQKRSAMSLESVNGPLRQAAGPSAFVEDANDDIEMDDDGPLITARSDGFKKRDRDGDIIMMDF